MFTEVEDHLANLKELLSSEEVIEKLDAVGEHTKAMADAYCSAYVSLFDSRREAFEKSIDELRNRPEWAKNCTEEVETLPMGREKDSQASETLPCSLPASSRLGNDEDRQKVADGKSLGSSTLGEMESDIAAADGLKSISSWRSFRR